jgi:hypothetical protein
MALAISGAENCKAVELTRQVYRLTEEVAQLQRDKIAQQRQVRGSAFWECQEQGHIKCNCPRLHMQFWSTEIQ